MAEKNVNARVKNLYLTASEWSTQNPVLLEGEIGFESDTGKRKVGDGSTAWNALSYLDMKVATSGELGKIKIGYTESGNNYPVELDTNNRAFVNVPWTDTKYTSGTGLSLSGTTFNHADYGSAKTVGPGGDSSLDYEGEFTVPYITTNAQGHVTASGNRTLTLPAKPDAQISVSNTGSGTINLLGTSATGNVSSLSRASGVSIIDGVTISATSLKLGSATITFDGTNLVVTVE